MKLTKSQKRRRVHQRIRKKVYGSSSRPRLCIFRSNKEIYCQLIDYINGVTLASASSKAAGISGATKSDRAKAVGQLIAERCQTAGIKRVVFDRGGFLYHGRVKALAEGAREGGLKF